MLLKVSHLLLFSDILWLKQLVNQGNDLQINQLCICELQPQNAGYLFLSTIQLIHADNTYQTNLSPTVDLVTPSVETILF